MTTTKSFPSCAIVKGIKADNFALAYYAGGSPVPKSLDWTESVSIVPSLDDPSTATKLRILANRREALRLIEERISEFIEYHSVPLQYIASKRRTEAEIKKLEQDLNIRQD